MSLNSASQQGDGVPVSVLGSVSLSAVIILLGWAMMSFASRGTQENRAFLSCSREIVWLYPLFLIILV